VTQPGTGGGGTVHVTQPGETLSAIANQYDTTWQALAEHNHIANPNLIHVGQEIAIPSSTTDTTTQPNDNPTTPTTPTAPTNPGTPDAQGQHVDLSSTSIHMNQFEGDPNGRNGDCGPTAMSMALKAVGLTPEGASTNDSTVDTVQAMRHSMYPDDESRDGVTHHPDGSITRNDDEHGTWTGNAALRTGAEAAGANVHVIDADTADIATAVQQGQPVVVNGNPGADGGDWSTYNDGHFITVSGYNPTDKTFTINDPLEYAPRQISEDQLSEYMNGWSSTATAISAPTTSETPTPISSETSNTTIPVTAPTNPAPAQGTSNNEMPANWDPRIGHPTLSPQAADHRIESQRHLDVNATFEPAQVAPGKPYMHIDTVRYENDQQSGGRHHIYVQAPEGVNIIATSEQTGQSFPGNPKFEDLNGDGQPERYFELPMWGGDSYSIQAVGQPGTPYEGMPSDLIGGLKMPANHHVNYHINFSPATAQGNPTTNPTSPSTTPNPTAPGASTAPLASDPPVVSEPPVTAPPQIPPTGDGQLRNAAGDVENFIGANYTDIGRNHIQQPTSPAFRQEVTEDLARLKQQGVESVRVWANPPSTYGDHDVNNMAARINVIAEEARKMGMNITVDLVDSFGSKDINNYRQGEIAQRLNERIPGVIGANAHHPNIDWSIGNEIGDPNHPIEFANWYAQTAGRIRQVAGEGQRITTELTPGAVGHPTHGWHDARAAMQTIVDASDIVGIHFYPVGAPGQLEGPRHDGTWPQADWDSLKVWNELASQAGKPMVIGEFSLPRDAYPLSQEEYAHQTNQWLTELHQLGVDQVRFWQFLKDDAGHTDPAAVDFHHPGTQQLLDSLHQNGWIGRKPQG
jgi:uncharacterized protein YvpB